MPKYNAENEEIYNAYVENGYSYVGLDKRFNRSNNAIGKRARKHRDYLNSIGVSTEQTDPVEEAENEIVSQMAQEAIAVGIDPADVGMFWYKSELYSMLVREKKDKVSYQDVRDSVIDSMQSHAPVYEAYRRIKKQDGCLLVIDPADVHMGKLCDSWETGTSYDNDIVFERVMDGVHGILQKSSGWNIEKILFIGGNDVLHTDNVNGTTTKGTRQDMSAKWYRNYTMARELYVKAIDLLLTVADVHYIHVPSNHDEMSGFFLADTIKAWYRNCGNVTFDVSPNPRKYFQFGKNLIGLTHGDGAKHGDLPLLMANEAPTEWASTKHRYVYTHHIHSKFSKDYQGVCVESLRSPSGTDSWHHKKGYAHAPKAIEGFVHHPLYGQEARITHIF